MGAGHSVQHRFRLFNAAVLVAGLTMLCAGEETVSLKPQPLAHDNVLRIRALDPPTPEPLAMRRPREQGRRWPQAHDVGCPGRRSVECVDCSSVSGPAASLMRWA